MHKLKVTLTTILLLLIISTGTFASFYYEIPYQKEFLTVDEDGTILLHKEFAFHVLPSSTEDGTEVWVGLPTDGTRVSEASYSLNGQSSTPTYDVEDDNDQYFVSFTRFPAIKPGQTGEFTFTAKIPDLVYWLDKKQLDKAPEDQLVSISYIPAWWEKGTVKNLELTMNLPQRINLEELTITNNPTSTQIVNGGLQLVWKYSNVNPNEKLHHAITLPRDYFAANFTPKQTWMSTSTIILITVFILVIVLGITILIVYSVKNRRYQTPIMYMKGDKAYTSFDPIETALFYNLSTDFISKLIIVGLMEKRVVQFKDNRLQRSATLESLNWYEELFLDSVDQNVEIIPEKWKKNFSEMVSHFYEKIKGYCGQQTMSYYNNLLKKEDFSENEDPRWAILQEQLAKGTFEKPDNKERISSYTPAYLNAYMPLFYMTVINSSLAQENHKQYSHVFPGATGGGGNSGPGCACACACACASSGGCT